ncbi:hypothetical protein Kpol_455p3 [Vanderwaltozyma polyspora DSM 70294]|uniref:Replication termination factor 2 n=1 Tax=Vanderwaltozyma polyspora (strain ATCC 22028 / DSM 70294 / BCRC 21397 / CBS 2163 / NBRC 10782 / NRRL Y-8283 / UCD 57-17) TaxID=436907 RepID=A7TR24_VANPO|nr:uncharacterized protein Kpol_455p3 [Vanderwaltozyma polyspora DSM 70294]EDO15272.1 hypothetical protein Kpol_455p3 [Vanderwaltozyma polyspora DSM 70294]
MISYGRRSSCGIASLLSMGNDGGSFSKSYNLKLELDKDTTNQPVSDDNVKEFQDGSIWKYCKLSNKPLLVPIVSDYKGQLFNKESVLEWLLTPEKEDYTSQQVEQFKHIKKLNDVIELKNIIQSSNGEIRCGYGDDVLGKNPKVRFIYISKCGDVLPKRIISRDSEKKCPVCNEVYEVADIVNINYEDSASTAKRLEYLVKNKIYHNGKSKVKKRVSKTNKITKPNH